MLIDEIIIQQEVDGVAPSYDLEFIHLHHCGDMAKEGFVNHLLWFENYRIQRERTYRGLAVCENHLSTLE